MKSPLLPCPFCGADAALDHVPDDELGIRPRIRCTADDCGAAIEGYVDGGTPIENVVAAWNRRTPAAKRGNTNKQA